MAAGHSMEAGLWPVLEGQLLDRIAGRFPRVETREHAGELSPDRMQHLLNRARWDTDGVAADLRGFLAQHLGEPSAFGGGHGA